MGGITAGTHPDVLLGWMRSADRLLLLTSLSQVRQHVQSKPFWMLASRLSDAAAAGQASALGVSVTDLAGTLGLYSRTIGRFAGVRGSRAGTALSDWIQPSAARGGWWRL
jgi:hypothetical protein